MFTRSIAIFLALFTAGTAVQAQEAMTMPTTTPKPAPEPTRSVRSFSIGGGAAYGIMLNGTSGFVLPQAPSCCSEYTSSTGSGFLVGAEFSLPLANGLDLGARLVYQASSVTFTADEPVTVRSGSTTAVTAFRHTLESSQGSVFLEPVLDWKVAGNLSLLGGVRVGTTLSGTYSQQEQLADPGIPYDFPDGRAVRNATEGDLENLAGLQMGFVFGARYRLPMASDGSLHLVPEVSFSPMLTDLVEETSWSVSPIRIGVSIVMDLMRTEAASTPLKP